MNGPSDVVPDVIPPPPGFPLFSWPIVSEHVTIEQSGSPLGDGGPPDVENLFVENLFAQDRLWAPIAVLSPDVGDRRETPVPRWRRLGRVRSWRSDLLVRSVHWGLVAVSGILCTAVRTMTCLRGSLDCPCIIRGSLSGSGFRSPPAFWR